MMREDIRVGCRANPMGFKQLGFKRLSSTQWVKDKMKVQVINGRIRQVRMQVNYHQPIFDFKSKNCRHEQTAREVVKLLR